jgi:hypothetical protein
MFKKVPFVKLNSAFGKKLKGRRGEVSAAVNDEDDDG